MKDRGRMFALSDRPVALPPLPTRGQGRAVNHWSQPSFSPRVMVAGGIVAKICSTIHCAGCGGQMRAGGDLFHDRILSAKEDRTW
jgi:hypothetical protein